MKEKKEDLRVRLTKKLLADALRKLMHQKAFEKISVRDICEEATVHRSTFYTHFSDKYDLLRYCLMDFEILFDQNDVTENNLKGYQQYYLNVAREIADKILPDKEFYQSILKKNQEDSILQGIQLELEKKIEYKLNKCKDLLPSNYPPALFATFYAGACISVLFRWLETDTEYSLDDAVTFLKEMTEFPILQ